MACGQKYAAMLRTKDGATPSDPWGLVPTAWDYNDWWEIAHDIGREVMKRWEWVLSIEDKLSKLRDAGLPVPVEGAYPERDALLFMLQQFTERLDKLRHVALQSIVPDGITWEQSILTAVSVGQEGACLLEMMDAAAVYYKRPSLPTVGGGHSGPGGGGDDKPEGGIGGILATVGLLGGALYYLRRRGKGKA